MVDMNRYMMTFNIQNYDSAEDMMNDVSLTMKALVKNGYVMTFKLDDAGIYVLEYAHDESKDFYGVANPYWITLDEYEIVQQYRQNYGEDETW